MIHVAGEKKLSGHLNPLGFGRETPLIPGEYEREGREAIAKNCPEKSGKLLLQIHVHQQETCCRRQCNTKAKEQISGE